MTRRLGLFIGVAMLAALWWWFGLADLAQAFRHASPIALLAYVLCATVVVLGHGLRWRLVARALGAAPPLRRLVAARLAGSAVSSLVPSANLAGEPVRAALARGWGLGGTHASAGVAIDRIAELIGNIVCAIAYLSVFLLTRGASSELQAPRALLGTMLLGLLAVSVPLVLLRRGASPFGPIYRWAAWLGDRPRKAYGPSHRTRLEASVAAMRGFEELLRGFFRRSFPTFVLAVLASLAVEGVVIGEYHFLLTAFGIDLDLPTLLMVLLGTGLARAVPTPGSLGALQASQVTVLTLTSGRADLGFVVGLLIGLHETLWLVIGLVALSVQGASLGGFIPKRAAA